MILEFGYYWQETHRRGISSEDMEEISSSRNAEAALGDNRLVL